MSAYDEVRAEDWESWVESTQATILDVREPFEWALGTLPNALLIPMGQILDRLDEVPKDKPVLCVCRSGGRSANVAGFLTFNEFKAANMLGGMKALGLQD